MDKTFAVWRLRLNGHESLTLSHTVFEEYRIRIKDRSKVDLVYYGYSDRILAIH